MATRKLDRFTLTSTALQDDPDGSMYTPAILVWGEGDAEPTIRCLSDLGSMSEAEAHEKAEARLMTVVGVRGDRLLWERPES